MLFPLNRHRMRALLLALLFCQQHVQAQTPSPIADNFLERPASNFSIPFFWQGDTINDKWEAHTAMLLPVKLKSCPRQLYMQFDLGSPSSLFYKNKIKAIRQQYPSSILLKDSAEGLSNFSFQLGDASITARQIVVQQFDTSGIRWDDTTAVDIIGTIGADLIDERIAVIDYPQQRISISTTLPPEIKTPLTWTNFVYAQRRILLPAIIRNRSTLLYFDTGSSLYELLTDQQTAESLAIPGSPVAKSQVKSWDKYLTANSLNSADSIAIGGCQLPIRRATYIEGVNQSQVNQMMKMGIGGMTGNTLFLDHQLILDTRDKKFAIIR